MYNKHKNIISQQIEMRNETKHGQDMTSHKNMYGFKIFLQKKKQNFAFFVFLVYNILLEFLTRHSLQFHCSAIDEVNIITAA